jgi:hypothetical protein
MGHHIQGFIASADNLTKAATTLEFARVVSLMEGFEFLPVTELLFSGDEIVVFNYFERLTDRLARWAQECSRFFALAYIETDYFGGVGSQAAIVWKDGIVAFSPVWTSNSGGKSTPLHEGAINRAAREIGVSRGTSLDEFEALGLDQHRDNDDWLGH